MRTDTPVASLRHGLHHLQLANLEPRVDEALGKQRLKLDAAADDDSVKRMSRAAGILQLDITSITIANGDRGDFRLQGNLHTEALLEPVRNRPHGRNRI